MAAVDATEAHRTETRPDATMAPGAVIAAPSTGPAPDTPHSAVWDALTANPGATVTAIAAGAGMSKAAARKALLALESDGHATRTSGGRNGGKRAPDAWQPALAGSSPVSEPAEETAADTETAETASSHADEPADESADVAPPAGTEPTDTATAEEADDDEANPAKDGDVPNDEAPGADAEDDASEAEPAEDGDESDEGMEPAAVTEANEALEALRDSVISALEALQDGDRAAALEASETIYTGSGKARRLVRAAANGRPRNASGRSRSNPGELRGKVSAHLAAYPGGEFTPHEIGKVIGHSAGAIANALDRLVALGEAVETCERPRRFTGQITEGRPSPGTGADTATETTTATP